MGPKCQQFSEKKIKKKKEKLSSNLEKEEADEDGSHSVGKKSFY